MQIVNHQMHKLYHVLCIIFCFNAYLTRVLYADYTISSNKNIP